MIKTFSALIAVLFLCAPAQAIAAKPSCSQHFSPAGYLGESYYVTPIFGPTIEEQAKDIAMTRGGRFIVVWGDGPTVSGSVNTSAGNQEFTLSFDTPTPGSSEDLAVAARGDEGFIVASAGTGGVFVQLLPGGTSAPHAAARVALPGGNTPARPVIAVNTDGGFLTAWNAQGNAIAQRFNANGAPIGTSFGIDLEPEDAVYRPDGSLDILGRRQNVFGTRKVSVQRFPEGPQSASNTFDLSDEFNGSTAAVLANGFVVAYPGLKRTDSGVFRKMFAQRYRMNGSRRGRPVGLSKHRASERRLPSIAGFGNGSFVVAWQRGPGQPTAEYSYFEEPEGLWRRVVGRRGGRSTRREIRLDAARPGYEPSVAATTEKRFVAAWHSFVIDSTYVDTCGDYECYHEYVHFHREIPVESCRKPVK